MNPLSKFAYQALAQAHRFAGLARKTSPSSRLNPQGDAEDTHDSKPGRTLSVLQHRQLPNLAECHPPDYSRMRFTRFFRLERNLQPGIYTAFPIGLLQFKRKNKSPSPTENARKLEVLRKIGVSCLEGKALPASSAACASQLDQYTSPVQFPADLVKTWPLSAGFSVFPAHCASDWPLYIKSAARVLTGSSAAPGTELGRLPGTSCIIPKALEAWFAT